MMKQDTKQHTLHKPTLKGRLIQIVLLCWIVPVVLVAVAMFNYLSTSLNEKTIQSYKDAALGTARIVTERLDGAVEASRLASYETVLKRAFQKYRSTGYRNEVLTQTLYFVRKGFRTDERFKYAVMWFWDDPEGMNTGVNNESLGVRYDALDTYWQKDHDYIRQVAQKLDTGVAFLNCDGRIYLVRNVMDGRLKPMAVLVLALNESRFFNSFDLLPWKQSMVLRIDEQTLAATPDYDPAVPLPPPPAGERPAYRTKDGDAMVYGQVQGVAYQLQYHLTVDTSGIYSQVEAYRFILAAMLAALAPLMFFAIRFFYTHISRPMEQLMAGAREVELGNFGVQLRKESKHREFYYLEESFNQMSLQLEDLFHRIYAEELSLRDARIKALQSQINPHFLNNTLELINWESRMSGNVKVVKMIEALSTMLDAAMARDGRKTVRLSEEMMYVDAYLYIIGERLGKRLTVQKEIDQTLLDYMVPRLILQPIIENAVEHGIAPRQQGAITLRIATEAGNLLLQIVNDGRITQQDRDEIDRLLGDEENRPQSSVRIGIRNVHQRLRIMYGKASGLDISEEGDNRVVATLTIPFDKVQP